jgi:hypothetical protein
MPYLKSDGVWDQCCRLSPIEVGAGVSGRITPFVGVYGEASYRTGVDDSLAIYKGDVGPRVRW